MTDIDWASKTIAVDFDGVLHSYTSGWNGYDPTDGPVDGALDFVHGLIASGYDVEVFSARADCSDGHAGITRWLEEHGFPPLTVSCEKGMHYVAFVDDRAVGFRGDFAATRESLDALMAHPKWWVLHSETKSE